MRLRDLLFLLLIVGVIIVATVITISIAEPNNNEGVAIVAGMTLLGTIVNTVLIRQNKRRVVDELDTGNGSRLGEMVAMNTNRLIEQNAKMDSTLTLLDEMNQKASNNATAIANVKQTMDEYISRNTEEMEQLKAEVRRKP